MAHPHSPMGRDGRQALPFSRRDFLRVRAMSTPFQRTTPQPTFVRAIRPWRDRGAQDRARRTDERTEKRKGSRTPTDAGLPACLAASAHPAGRARLSAFHGGSALGTHASQGAVSDQVSRRWRLDGGGLPPAPTRLQRAPRTPVIVPADMMSDTARVQRGRTLCARAPHLAPASRSHRLASLYEEREARAFIPKICRVKPNHWRALLFDSTTLFAVPSGNATVHTNLGELKSLIRKPGACRHSAPYVFRYRSIRPTGAFSLRRNDRRN